MILKKIILLFLFIFSLTQCKYFYGSGFSGQGLSPKDIPGTILWLRADKGAMTNVTFNCTPPLRPANIGELVSCWEDQSPSKSNAFSGGGTYLSTGINGKNSMNIQFMSSFNSVGSIDTNLDITIFTVNKADSSLSNPMHILNIGPGVHDQAIALDLKYVLNINPTGRLQGSPTILTSLNRNSMDAAYVNGKLVAESYFPSSFGTFTFTIGSTSSPSGSIEIPEIIVYNRALSDSERQEIELYLSKKYGIPLE